MSRRIRDLVVALFVLGGIALGIFAFFWFSGRLARGDRKLITVFFPDATGLQVGDPVSVLGIEKGRVAKLVLDTNGVVATVSVDRDLRLAPDTRIAIRSVSYLGNDRFLMVRPGESTGSATAFRGANEALDLEEIVLRLNMVMAKLDPAKLGGELRGIKDELIGLLDKELSGFNSNLGGTMASVEHLANRLDTLAQMVNSQSTAGKLVGSDELYEEVRQTNEQVQALVKDVKEHPERYVKLRFSLF